MERQTVLVVDDEPDIVHLVEQVFRLPSSGLQGLDVLVAGSAEDALRLLERNDVDVVLTDFRMPGRTGAELLADVRKRWPTARRILMTGYDEGYVAEVDQTSTESVEYILQKPWDIKALIDTVHEALEAPSGDGNRAQA
ncbi:MAG: response regulator [Thermoplasmatota archaeon]